MKPARGRGEYLRFFQVFTLISTLTSPLTLGAAETGALLNQTNLFEAGAAGYALYRIPGVVVSSKGTVLVYCEARRTGGDWAAIDILARRSIDGGKSWEAPFRIADVPGPKPKNPIRKKASAAEITYNNPVAIAEANGRFHFLFCLEYMRCFHQTSDDEGLTWSKPEEITKSMDGFRSAFDWKVIATGPGHGIELRNHRLVVPIWLSLGQGPNNHTPSVSSAIFSDDHGQSWSTSDIAIPGSGAITNANECAVVELPNGDVMLNARNHSPEQRRAIVLSSDGGKHWAGPRLQNDLPEPVCMAGFIRYSGRGQTNQSCLLLSQPAAAEIPPGKSGKRENLSIRLSRDDGKTWPVSRSLEAGASAYSDLAEMPDGTILCFYERANGGSSPYGMLTLAKFSLSWLTEDGKTETPRPN